VALKQNTSLHILICETMGGELTPFGLGGESTKIQVLQPVDLRWCEGLVAMPFLLAGLRKNASLLRFHVESESKLFSPATNLKKRPDAMAAGCGNWQLGYRGIFPLLHTPKRLPPRGVWLRARVTTLLMSFFMRCSVPNPNLVPSEVKVRKPPKIHRSGQNASAVTIDRRLCHGDNSRRSLSAETDDNNHLQPIMSTTRFPWRTWYVTSQVSCFQGNAYTFQTVGRRRN
jgi:hypothetical protein